MTTATAPLANPSTLGLAHYAARGLLEHVLARYGSTFLHQMTLRSAVTAAEPQTPDDLVADVRGALKADPADIRAAVDELTARGLLVADGPHILATDAGRDMIAAVAAETAPITARVWGDIPTEDLAAAARVLALVAERANKELDALS